MCKSSSIGKSIFLYEILNLRIMFLKKSKSKKTKRGAMIPLVLFMLSFHHAFSSGEDTLTVKNDSVAALPKSPEIKINPNPGLLSDQSASELRAGLIFDATTSTVVWEKDMGYAYPIASLTKMMVALIAIEDIKAGKADWQDVINATHTYRKSRRSRKTYTVHETYSLEGLLKMAMIPSHNEACNMIAKHLGGTVDAFVERMNSRALSLGMTQTYYSNPSGLPASYGALDNSASPKDLLMLAMELIKYPEILSITNIGYAEVENGHGSLVYRNHNRLVIDYPEEVDGLKTGYTKNARFCLVATAKKNDHRLIAIALGARGPYLRNQIVTEMLNNYYGSLGLATIGNQPAQPLYAKAEDRNESSSTKNLNISSTTKTVYKTVTSIVKKPHVVKNGQTLSEIADKYNCSVSELKKWNRLKSTRINKGQRLYVHTHVKKQIPVKIDVIENYDACEDDAEYCGTDLTVSNKETKQEQPVKAATKTKNPSDSNQIDNSKFVLHTVQPGDTLWSISQKYPGNTVEGIKKLNRISNSKGLKAGSKIKIAVNS